MIGIRHFGIVVSDLERALHFYRDLLGLKAVRASDEQGAYLDNMLGLSGARVLTVKLGASSGQTLVELLEFKSVSEKVGQASSLPVHGASSPRVSGGKMPPEPADKMSAPHFRTRSKSHRVEEGEKQTLTAIGPTHVAFTVSDLDQLFARLTEQSVRFNAPPQLAPDGKAKVTFCFDPDGTPIELVEELETPAIARV